MHIEYIATRSIQSSHIVSELVTDGTIDTACGVSWTCGTGWAISSGVATHTAGNTAPFYQSITFVAGTTYEVSFSVTGGASAAGTVTGSLGGVSGVPTANPVSDTSIVTLTFAAGSSNSLLEFTPSSDFNGSIDDISVIITSEWSLYPATETLAMRWETKIKQRRTDTGITRTIRRGRDKFWSITTEPLLRSIVESDYEEFFDSVSAGESFTIDPYVESASDSEDSPIIVVMDGDPTFSRASTTDFFSIGFKVRILPT